MADRSTRHGPDRRPPEQRRIAAENFDRGPPGARRPATTTTPSTCCSPAASSTRPTSSTARRSAETQKDKYGNNLRGSRFAFLTTAAAEGPASRPPSAAATTSRCSNTASRCSAATRGTWAPRWTWPRRSTPSGCSTSPSSPSTRPGRSTRRTPTLNRALARLFEKRGDFQKAIVLWQLVQGGATRRTWRRPTRRRTWPPARRSPAASTRRRRPGSKESPVLGRIEARRGREAGQAGPRRRPAPEADRGRPDRADAVPPTRRRLPPARPGRPRPGRPPAGPRADRQPLPAPARADGTRPRAVPQEPGGDRGEAEEAQGAGRPRTTRTTTARPRRNCQDPRAKLRQGDQRPRDRHLPAEGGPLPDRPEPPARTRARGC